MPPHEDDDNDDEFSDDDDDNDDALRGPRGAGRDDDFDEFEESMGQYGAGGGGGNAQAVQNKPYDEAVELSDSADSPGGSPAGPPGMSRPVRGGGGPPANQADAVQNQPFDEAHDLTSEGSVDDDDDDDDAKSPQVMSADPARANAAKAQMGSSQGMGGGRGGGGSDNYGSMAAPRDEEDDEPDERPRQPTQRPGEPTLSSLPPSSQMQGGDDDDGEYGGGEGGSGQIVEGMYDPAEYASLPVSAEINELFQYITRYKPHNIEMMEMMRPFIPDYIPAVGDIDPFIKIPRPDGKADNLGLVTLDEPASTQSDPTVLTLQLRAVSKSSGAQPMLVRAVENAEKDPKAITGWINSIADLHRHKPAPSVRYTKPMPDIEQLMQIWPGNVEELLENAPLPDADINLDLASYVRVVCGMLDIPVYGSLTESLHVLFTLYSDFKANVHFQQQLASEQQETGGPDMGGGYGGYGDGPQNNLEIS